MFLGPLGAILEPSWGHLGPSWAILEPSWSHLGTILVHLAAILGHPKAKLRFLKDLPRVFGRGLGRESVRR